MDHFKCGLKIILESQICDGAKDCANGEDEQPTNALISVGTLFGIVLLVWVANCAAAYWRSKKIHARTKERARGQNIVEERLGCGHPEPAQLRTQQSKIRLALPAPSSTISFQQLDVSSTVRIKVVD
ncbi:hypothetical protein RvY_02828 [Ramazzottius varieornatus]|uniref:Uncharacterized protein n=1 Tax=Ramazzottius varieornatus TaxID=947166 RepID=A0A1D1ULU7_RAMVA|nr:hypothetical protein RvY_02828 [Ramazzottius varieornatus]